jgi:putative MATE family efflux protein
MAARRLGEGHTDRMAVPLNGGLLLAFAMGLPLSVLLFLAAPSLYPYLNGDPEVIREGVPYLQARLCATVAVGMNFAFRGYFNGVDLSKIYLRSLLVMHACNLLLNYMLIFGHFGMPQLGATGAGIGTAISTFIGTLTYTVMAYRVARGAGFLRGIPDGATLRSMLRLSLPTSLQQLFFATGLTTLFWIVGKVGTTPLAAANVMVNLMLVAILPSLGLGLAAASLVGQALGRGDRADAKRWGWEVVQVAVVVLFVIGLPMVLAPDLLMSGFTSDATTIAVARWPLRLVGLTIWIDGIGLVLQNAMLGAGYSRRIMVVAIGLQWGVFLPSAYVVGPVLGLGLTGIWLAQVVHRGLQAGCFAVMWRAGKWADVSV